MPQKAIQKQELKLSPATSALQPTKTQENILSQDGRKGQFRNNQPLLRRGGEKRSSRNPLVKQVSDLKRQLAQLQRLVSQFTKGASQAGRVEPKPGQSNGLPRQDRAPAGPPKFPSPISPKPNKGESPARSRNRSNLRSERRKSMSSDHSSTQNVARTQAVRGNTSVSSVKQSTATVVVKKPVLKKMPQVTGISEECTLIRNDGVLCPDDPCKELPEKGIHYTKVVNPRPHIGGQDLRSRNIEVPALQALPGKVLPIIAQPKTRKRTVDEELTGYLIYEFMFQPRTSEVMCRMAAKAKRYLSQFDCLQFTHFELHEFVVGAVEAAMNIPSVELHVRASLQDFDQATNRGAHASLVRDGKVGRAPIQAPWPFDACLAGSKLADLPAKRL